MAIDWAARRKAANKKTVEPKYDAKTSYSWKSQLRPIAELEQEIQQKNYERITSSEDFGVMPSASVPGSIAQKGINLRNQINVERPKIEYNAYQKNVEAGAKARNMTVPAYEKFIQMEIEKQNELEKPSKGATGLMGIIADKIIKENKRTTFTKPVDNLVMEQTKKLMDSGVMKGAQVISGGFATGATGVQEAFTGLAKAMYAPSNEVNKWATDYAKSKGILVPNFNPYSMLDDFAKRSSIMRDVAKKNIGYYDSNSTVQFMSDMVEQLPSQMLQALPGGRVLYTLYAIGSSVNQYIKGEQPWYKEWTMALGAAGIDAGTEALFPMFGKGKRSIMKLLGKMAEKSPKFIPTMLDYVKMAGLSFASEGAEEGLSYLGTTLLDWAVMKEMKGDTELNLGDASKQMLMGALSGLLLSGMPMVLAGSDINAKKELNDAISNALNKKPTEVTVADIERVVKTTADAAIETGYVPGTATSNVAQTAEEKRKSRVESVVNKYKNVVGTLPNSTTSTNVGTVATDVAPIQTAPIAQSEVAPVAPIAPTKETVVKPTAPVKKYVKADDGKYTQQPQQNIVQNVNMQESAPVVESKQQEGKQVKKFVGEDEFSIVRRKYESDKHITTPPATITENVVNGNVTDNKTVAEKATTESTYISAEQAKELGPIKTKVANKYIEEHKDMTAEQAKDEIAKAMLGEGIHVDLQKFAFRELVDVLKDDNAKSLVKRFLGELGDKIGVDAQNTLERMRMGDEEYSEFVTSYVKRTHKADMALAEEHIKSDDKMIDLTLRANVGDKMLSPDEMLALMLKADAVLNAPETYEGEHANWLSTLDSVSSLATKMGQSISIIAKFYQETNRAKNLESTLIDKKQKKRIKDGTDGITEVLKKERTRSIKEVVSDIIKKPKEAVSDEQSLLDKIDKLTHKDNKTKTENDVVAVVPELVRWFKTELKSMIGQSVESDGYALLANVVTNRDKFKSVWDGARKLANDQYSIDDAEFEKMRSYIEKELVPSINRNRLDKILANAMSKDGANVSLSDIVAGYEQSGQRLKDYILAKTNLSGDDAIFLSNEIDARLREKIADRRAIIVKQLNQMQGDKGRIVKARKSLEDKLSEIVGLDLLNTDALRTIYAEKLNLPVFDDAMTMDVMETVKQINKLDRTVDYKKITELWSDLANRISSKVKITWGDRAMAYRKTMMLSNPATQMRNVASNFGMNLVRRFEEMFTRNVMGKVLGMQLASTHERYTKYHANVGTYVGELATGKRKLGDMFSTKIWGGTVSYNEGVDADTAKTVSSSWTTDGKPNILNNDKFKVLKAEWIFKTMRGQQKGYKKALALGEKAMDSLATTVRDSLKNGDLAFAESAYKNAMIGYMKKNGLSAPNADAISYANKAAEEATFRGVNMVSDWIAQGKHKGVVMKWMIDTVIPFAETPTNITKAVWERTGFSGAWELKSWLVQNYNIKHNPNWAQENPKKYKSDDYYAQKFTRSIVGTFGGFGGGIVLQLLGFLTGAKPQDEKERKRWEMNGIVPYALHIPETNIYVTLDWLQPAAAQLMVGASFSQAMQQDEGFIQAVLSGASGGIDSIMNMTLFTSLKRVLGGQWQDASASLFSIVESYANQFLPAYTNALAKTIDGTVRNTWSPEVGGDIATTFIMRSGLGGFWMMPKVDAWGNDVKQPQATGLGMLERGINSFLAPWKVSNLAVDNVTKEVTKIYGKAVDGDAKQPGSVLPQIDISNPKAFPYEGDYYTLTEEEYYKYMKYRGQYAHAMIQALMSDSEYNSLPDYADKGDSKFSWISDVYTEAATKAKEKLGKPKNINK